MFILLLQRLRRAAVSMSVRLSLRESALPSVGEVGLATAEPTESATAGAITMHAASVSTTNASLATATSNTSLA